MTTNRCLHLKLQPQNCTIPGVFVLSVKFTFSEAHTFFVILQCSVLELWTIFFSLATFLAEFFLSTKIRLMKAGKKPKYDVTKTSDLAQVCSGK